MSVMTLGPAWAMDGPTYDGVNARTAHVAAAFFNSGAGQVATGVLPAGGQLAVTAGSGMSVGAAPGYAVIASGAGSTYGGYLLASMSAANLTIATSDPVNPRIDLVCASVDDLGTSSSVTELQVVTGTPAPSPSAPVPSGVTGYVPLAQVLVPAGSSSVSGGNITDVRPWTAAQGGVIPIWASGMTGVPAGYTGLYVHDQNSGRLAHDPAGTLKQPHVLPFAPQQAYRTAPLSVAAGTTQTICSVSVTCDGSTDLECTYKWTAIQQSVPANCGLNLHLLIDGTEVDRVEAQSNSVYVANNGYGGGCVIYRTNSVQGTTPSSGTHTVAFTAQNTAGSGTVTVTAGTTLPCYLYVKAACL